MLYICNEKKRKRLDFICDLITYLNNFIKQPFSSVDGLGCTKYMTHYFIITNAINKFNNNTNQLLIDSRIQVDDSFINSF